MNSPQRVVSHCARLCRRRSLSSVSRLPPYNNFYYQFHVRQFHATPTTRLSDNLLGHSPMARPTPHQSTPAASPPASGPVWGVDSNTAGGGVWAQTSSKRDKLNELLTELNADGVDTGTKGMETLDEAASEQEKLDLEFADGLKAVAKFVHHGMKNNVVWVEDSSTINTKDAIMVGRKASLAAEDATKQMFQLLESACSVEEWDKPKFEATLQEAIRILSKGLPPDPDIKNPVAGSLDISHPFCYLREFVEYSTSSDDPDTFKDANTIHNSDEDEKLEYQIQQLNNIIAQAFSSSTQLYRTLILRATCETLLENWDTITTVTSGDIDRAAVSKTTILPQRSTVNAKNIRRVFDAYYGSESSTEWVKSWWNLIDADEDGLIDEEEMNHCIDLAMKPIHSALSELVYMSLEVCPVRSAGLGNDDSTAWFLGGDDIPDLNVPGSTNNPSAAANLETKKLLWRNRRRELKARKALVKTFQATLARHFRDQVETPHRLRCIYAWADKKHQNNKIDSIVVDASEDYGAASSIMGRKRYVELVPKIAYPEFRKEQARHFPHFDRVGEELATSFKEDLWVLQGKGRQNKELRRDCFLFLLGISLVDVVITLL